jgi:ferredoxin
MRCATTRISSPATSSPLGSREAAEVEARFPKVQRRVGGYNLDALVPKGAANNMAHILVGSEGTLAFTTAVDLKLWPLLGPKVFGICHFGAFHEAMDAAQHLVTLKPIAVELVDRTMIGPRPRHRHVPPDAWSDVVRGGPDALLVVEFAEETRGGEPAEAEGISRPAWATSASRGRAKARASAASPVVEPAWQAASDRDALLGPQHHDVDEGGGKAGLLRRGLRRAAPRPRRLHRRPHGDLPRAHGTEGTWYAHASVGCLHVRPVLNMKLDVDAKRMRPWPSRPSSWSAATRARIPASTATASSAPNSTSRCSAPRLDRAFEEVKDRFDPEGLFNPGKITRAPRMDDRTLFRYPAGLSAGCEIDPALDWSDYPGASQGFLGAIEMCNNNGTCRKLDGGAMCPSYRVTRDEQHVTRGRANTLRLAMTGQLGPDALTSTDEMEETLSLCVSCKACKRECPTGVDMARMKIEVKAARYDAGTGARLHEPPRRPSAALCGLSRPGSPWLFNLRDRVPGLAASRRSWRKFSACR